MIAAAQRLIRWGSHDCLADTAGSQSNQSLLLSVPRAIASGELTASRTYRSTRTNVLAAWFVSPGQPVEPSRPPSGTDWEIKEGRLPDDRARDGVQLYGRIAAVAA